MDYPAILTLLQICDLAKEWPDLKPIHDAAMAELADGGVKGARAELGRRAEVKAQAEREANQKKAAEIEANAKAQAKTQPKPVPQRTADPTLQQQTTDGRRSENVPVEEPERRI